MQEQLEIILRTVAATLFAYTGLLVFLRISGKRTLSKWNAFDLVVTVALGSCLATTIVSGSTPVPQGLTAFACLIVLQWVISKSSVHSRVVRDLVKSEPSLLLYRGSFRHETLKRERVAESEVYAALRQEGIADVSQVGAVVLESNGSFSVIPELSPRGQGTLQGISGAEEEGG